MRWLPGKQALVCSILARLAVIYTWVGFLPDINQKRQQVWGWMPVLENVPFSVGVAGWRSTDCLGAAVSHPPPPDGLPWSPSGTRAWGLAAEWDVEHGMWDVGYRTWVCFSLATSHCSIHRRVIGFHFLPSVKAAFDPCCCDGIRREKCLILLGCAGTPARAGATFTSQGDRFFRSVTKSSLGSESPICPSCHTCTDTASGDRFGCTVWSWR